MTVNLTVCARTDIGKRATNEDAFVIADLTGNSLVTTTPISRFEIGAHGVLLAVSDGMGGHAAGEVASALVVESLRRSMAASVPSVETDSLLPRAVEKANREAWEASQAPGRQGMGATVTALFLDGATAHIAEVGDSRAYVLRGGELLQVTRDQSYVQLLVDAGTLSPEDAARAPFRNVIMQAMGQKPDVQVALGKLALRRKDCFLVCSDGLTNKVPPDEIARTILGAPRLDVACDRLIALALERGGDDNITAILGGVSGDLPPLVAGETIASTLEVVQEWGAPIPGP
jgi:PPM family protein phosphatase